tara:strand:+ start:166 stop:921 length:756 start_codon:yes stop_codon:yes gene_type:complete
MDIAAGGTSAHKNPLLVAVIVGGLLYIGGQYIASQPLRIQQEVSANREITVVGTGDVTAIPDIATISLGVTTGPQPTAERALSILTTRFNGVVKSLEKLGVEKKDIKATNISLNPDYDFIDGERRLRGYTASESVRVKIRKLDTAGQVLAAATGEGVNQVSGLSFDIDDPSALEAEAQEEAIEDAKTKAERLAKALGTKLGDVKSFTASGGPGPPIYARAELSNLSLDEGPPVPAGSQDVTTTVTITYSLR